TTGPNTLRSFAIMIGEPWQLQTWQEMPYSVKTGRPAFEHVFGLPVWEYFEKNPDAGRIFAESMISFSGLQISAVMASYDFSSYSTIIDVGGGTGHFLTTILKATPQATGILFDLPGVVENARRFIATKG